MGKINLFVHPLFFLFGLYYALTGRIFLFAICTVSAVIHELGHSYVASSKGYKLNKITLMPFGAVVSGDIDGLKPRDEIMVALAGPFINLAVGIFFVATWWIFPESYAFTDVVAQTNFSLAIVNFLPIFPLDGGRVLTASLSEKLGRKRAFNICKWIGGFFALLLLAGFIFTLFNTVNLSLLFFSLFVLFGAFGKNKDNVYVKLFTALDEKRLKRGMDVKRQALHKNASVKKLLSMLEVDAVNEIVVFDDEKPIKTLTQDKLKELIESADLYSPIGRYV